MVLVNTYSTDEPMKNSRPKSGVASSCSERDIMRFTSKKSSQEEFQKQNKGTRAGGKAKASTLASNSFNQDPIDGFGKAAVRKIPVLARTKVKRRFEGGHPRLDSVRKPEKGPPKEKHLQERFQSDQPKDPDHGMRKTIIKEASENSLSASRKLDFNEKSSDLDCDRFKMPDLRVVPSEVSRNDGKDDFSAFYSSKELKKLMKDFEERLEDEVETRRHQKVIENLYEALRHKGETFFFLRRPEPSSPSTTPRPATVQQFYDTAIEDIFNVWTDAVDLIKSVKDHTLSFMEDKSKMVDREQLTLEAEMVQLAVDFAVNFSKLKTDFLLKEVRKHLQLKDWESCDLQAFMDSKLLPAVYSLEDLSTMARTVRELNVSFLAEDESE